MSTLAAVVLLAVGAFVKALPPTGDPGEPVLLLALPGSSWSLSIDPPAFEFGKPEIRPDGQMAWAVGDSIDHGYALTALLVRTDDADSAVDCRDGSRSLKKRGTSRGREIRHSTRGEMVLASYHVDSFHGMQVDQRHLHAFMLHDRVCIEVELSMPDYRDKHEALFEELLDSVALIDLPAPTPKTP